MKWSEVRRIAERQGWRLVRFGRKHDVYERDGDILLIERHSSQELRGKVYQKIREQLNFMKTSAVIETGSDGGFDIVLMELKHHVIFGDGETVEEAKKDLQNSYEEVLALYEEEGKPVPEELRDLEFDYKYDISSFLRELKWINLSSLARVLGLNRSLLYQYKKGNTYISHQQMKRIEAGVHELGRKMLEFSVK